MILPNDLRLFNEKCLQMYGKYFTFALALETEVGNAGERPTRDKVQSKACPLQLWSCKSTHCRGSFYAQPTLMKGGSRVWGGNEPQILQPHRKQHAYLSYSSKKPNRRKRILNGFSKAFQRQACYFVKKSEENAKNAIFTPFKPT